MALRGTTRNAVIAKVHRLRKAGVPLRTVHTGLSGAARLSAMHNVARKGAAALAAAKARSQAALEAGPEPARAAPRVYRLAGSGAVFEQASAQAPRRPPPLAKAWAPLQGVEPVPMSALRHSHCRWPVEVAGAEEPMSCGAFRIGGAYCPTHTERARPRPGAKEALDRELDIPAPRRVA